MSAANTPVVQAGDPLRENVLIEATVELFAKSRSRASKTWVPPESLVLLPSWRPVTAGCVRLTTCSAR